MTTPTTRFPSGTFSASSSPAAPGKILAAQAKIESLLFLRHGEQQLLSLVIPLGLLIGLTLVPFHEGGESVMKVFPMSLAVALMGAGFTGQAIAVAFDRRYGALKRLGACGVPTWALIGGKICAVGAAVVVQIVILSTAAFFLGWKPSPVGIAIALLVTLVGVAAFTSLGLFLGGLLSSEMVLALGNTLWFLLMGAAVLETVAAHVTAAWPWIVAVPSVALTRAFHDALAYGSVHWVALGVLGGWAVVGAAAAVKFFRFTMPSD